MRGSIKVILFVSISLFLLTSGALADYGDIILEQQGNIRLMLGYLSGQGVSEGYGLTFDNLMYSYSLNLSGTAIKDNSNLSYAFSKEVGDDLNWSFHWTNPWFALCYDRDIRLDFPEINLAFTKNAVDGFEFETLEDESSLTLFYGKEAIFPMTIVVRGFMPGTTKIRLFDYYNDGVDNGDDSIPASGGDIVEYSEIITANGITLKREEDYILNYLNSDLTLLTPLNPETVLEAKFQFKPTKEELSLPTEILQGGVYTQRWLENNLTTFYIKRGDNLIDIGGIAGRYVDGPISIEGEWAISDGKDLEQGHAYYLDMKIMEEKFKADYKISTIDDEFRNLGVSSFAQGLSQEISLDYQCAEDFNLILLHSTYYEDTDQEVTNSLTQEIIDCQITENQSCQFIVEDLEMNTEDLNKRKTDIALGYTYEKKPFTLSLGQYLIDPDNRFVECSIDLDNLTLGSDYTVAETIKGKEHQLNIVSTLRPIDVIDINTILEYRHLYENLHGDVRLLVNANTFAIPGFSGTGQYVYFTRQKDKAEGNRYILDLNYNKFKNSSYKLYYLRINNNTQTSKSYVQEVQAGASFPVLRKFKLEYSGDLDSYNQETKQDDSVYSGSDIYLQNLTLGYLFNDYLTLNTKLGYKINHTWNNVYQDGEYVTVHTKNNGFVYGIGAAYEKAYNQNFSLEVIYEPVDVDPLVTCYGKIRYPLVGSVLDLNSELGYNLDTQKLGSKSNLALTLPQMLKIEPKISYQHENSLSTPLKMDSFSLELKYKISEKQSIFLQGMRDYKFDLPDAEDSSDDESENPPQELINSWGIVMGLEFGF